jgi:hypothetical protein
MKLNEYRMFLHLRPVTDDEHIANSITFGDSITTSDLQLVAYTLIDQGLPIQNIAPSKYHDNWKAHSIEIGVDTTVFDRPIFGLSDVRALSQK